jgi:hypothetical protein
MGIRTLDETHKRFAEMILTGKPATKREQAEALGVDRSTLYHWAKDPLFQKYVEKLAEELEAARVERMSPLVFSACDAVAACLANAVRDLESMEKDERARAPGLSTLVSATKTLVELERVDRGKPSSITKREVDATEKPNPATERLLHWLDKLATGDGEDEASETHTAVAH